MRAGTPEIKISQKVGSRILFFELSLKYPALGTQGSGPLKIGRSRQEAGLRVYEIWIQLCTDFIRSPGGWPTPV